MSYENNPYYKRQRKAKAAQRVSKQTLRLAHTPILPRPGYAPAPHTFVNPGVINAKTGAGGIPAMSGSTPGSATVTLQNYDIDANSLSAGDTATVKHVGATAVGANKNILVAWGQGALWTVVESC